MATENQQNNQGNSSQQDANQNNGSVVSDVEGAWTKFYHKHPNQVKFGAFGLALALAFIIFGLGATIVLALFVAIGILYGRYKDGDRKTSQTVQNVLGRFSS